jgi:hypothetical protein
MSSEDEADLSKASLVREERHHLPIGCSEVTRMTSKKAGALSSTLLRGDKAPVLQMSTGAEG